MPTIQEQMAAGQEPKTKLTESHSSQSWEWAERKKSTAEELCAIHKTMKLLSDGHALELCRAALLCTQMVNTTSLNAAMSAGVPQSSMFGAPDLNEEKNIVDMPVVVRRVCMDAQTQFVDTCHAESNAVCGSALLKQSIENQLTQDSKALTKTLEVTHSQYLDRLALVPDVSQRQVPLTPKVQETVETPELQFIDEVVDGLVAMPKQGDPQDLDVDEDSSTENTQLSFPPLANPGVHVVMQRQVLVLQKVQRIVDVPLVHYIDAS